MVDVSITDIFGQDVDKDFETKPVVEGKGIVVIRTVFVNNGTPTCGANARLMCVQETEDGELAGEFTVTAFAQRKDGSADEYSQRLLQQIRKALGLKDINELASIKNARVYARVRKDYNQDGTEKLDSASHNRYKLWDVEAVGLTHGPTGQGSVMQSISVPNF